MTVSGRLAVLSAALCLMLGVACGGETGRRAEPLAVHLRFVERDPEVILAREELLSAERLFTWRPPPEERCAAIVPAADAAAEITLGGQRGRIERLPDRIKITFDVRIDAGSVDRLEVVLRSLDSKSRRIGPLSLYWAGAGEAYSADRMSTDAHGEIFGADRRRYRLALGAHPGWLGAVARLSLVILPEVGAEFALCAIEGLAETIRGERLVELAAAGFKANLADQIRNALPGVPGLPVERELVVPRGAELRFAYALQPGVDRAVTFRVTARPAGGPTRELFAAALGPGDEPEPEGEGPEGEGPQSEGPWHEGRADLAPLAGERIILTLATAVDGALALKRGFPLWGNPEVVAPRR